MDERFAATFFGYFLFSIDIVAYQVSQNRIDATSMYTWQRKRSTFDDVNTLHAEYMVGSKMQNRKKNKRRKRVTSSNEQDQYTLHAQRQREAETATLALVPKSYLFLSFLLSRFASVAAAVDRRSLCLSLSDSLCECWFDICIRIQSWRVEFLVWKFDVRWFVVVAAAAAGILFRLSLSLPLWMIDFGH